MGLEKAPWFTSHFGMYQKHFTVGDGADALKSVWAQCVLFHIIFWACKTHALKKIKYSINFCKYFFQINSFISQVLGIYKSDTICEISGPIKRIYISLET